jgi:hypothetical protein
MKTFIINSCVKQLLENPMTDLNCKDDNGKTLI